MVRTKKNKREGYISRSTSVPRLGLGGLSQKARREKTLRMKHINYRKRQKRRGGVYVGIFEPIPEKKSAIASGATPIGSAIAHSIERSRQKEEELKSIIKNQLVDKWFRCNRLYFVSNKLRLHCRQNKHPLVGTGPPVPARKGL
jgi:hypothetical protein